MEEFIEKVDLMRQMQKEYYKAQRGTDEKQNYLVKSKQLEREVDQMIEAQRTRIPACFHDQPIINAMDELVTVGDNTKEQLKGYLQFPSKKILIYDGDLYNHLMGLESRIKELMKRGDLV